MLNLFVSLFLLGMTALVPTTNATRNGLLGSGQIPGGGYGIGRRKLLDLADEKLSWDPNNIAQRWKELSGENNWEGLLNPLDSDLQKYLVHYAALCQATYDALDMDPGSPTSGDCKFPMDSFFAETGLVLGNPFKYRIVKYLYASESPIPRANVPPKGNKGSKDSNWIGYIAVTTDEGKKNLGRRDIVVAWRGTIKIAEWIKDLDAPLVSGKEIVGKITQKALMHQGFLTIYTSHTSDPKTSNTSAQEQVLSALQKLLEQYKDEEVSITVTGHSLGAAIALVCGTDIAANGYNRLPNGKTSPVAIITYGGPRVGDITFRKALSSLSNLRVLRVVNKEDVVPRVPWAIIYAHVGMNLTVNSLKSPYLVMDGDPVMFLHVEEVAYLHPLSIANGAKNLRSLACVNKFTGALNPKYKIPKHWWEQDVKPLVQQQDGSWVLKPKLPGD